MKIYTDYKCKDFIEANFDVSDIGTDEGGYCISSPSVLEACAKLTGLEPERVGLCTGDFSAPFAVLPYCNVWEDSYYEPDVFFVAFTSEEGERLTAAGCYAPGEFQDLADFWKEEEGITA